MSQINEFIIGVDVSKNKIDIYILSTNSHVTIENRFRSITKFFKEAGEKNSISKVVLEATGGYERTLVKALSELKIPFHVAHPNQVYHFAKSKRLLAKTDKIDAKILALFGKEEHATITIVKSEDEQELESLIRRKQQLTDLLTDEKIRSKGPLAVGEMSRSIKRIVKCIEQEIKLINNKLKERVKSSEIIYEKIERLKTFKGIGESTATLLAISVPELGKVTRSSIGSLLGLAPINHDSGEKKGHRSIRGGRFHVRRGLYMATLSAIKSNPSIRAFYKSLISRGKKAKVAIVAVMRKIVVTLNGMIRDSKNWEEQLNY